MLIAAPLCPSSKASAVAAVGRQLLPDAVDVRLCEGRERVVIEAATDNERALGRSRSCRFAVATAYGFSDLAA